MANSPTVLLIPLLIVAAAIFSIAGFKYYTQSQLQTINNFDDCALAGYPIMESYPEQCATPDGRSFTRDISNLPQTTSSPAMPAEPSDPAMGTGEPITVTGEFTCLPHRDTSGPQTLECAFGLLTDEGTYYALRDSDPNYRNLMSPSGSKVTVVGLFTPQADTKYQSLGLIEIKTVTPVAP